MSRPISSAAVPIAYILLRILIVVNWLGGAAILALLVVMPNEQWIMSAFNEDLVHNRRMTLTELADRIGMALTSNQAACANSQVGKGRLRPLKILSNSSMTINSPLTGWRILSGGKPPFPTCEFLSLEWYPRSFSIFDSFGSWWIVKSGLL